MNLMRNRKGFVLTFAAILLTSIILFFAMYYMEKNQSEENAIRENLAVMQAGFIADDVASDVEKIIGTSIDIFQEDVNTLIVISDYVPSRINKSELDDLEAFLEGGYKDQQNCSVDVNFSRLRDDKSEMIFSNSLQYDQNYEGDDEIIFYNPGGNANVLEYDINIYVTGNLQSYSAWDWNTSGEIKVNLNYSDRQANTINETGSLSSYLNNQYDLNYPGGYSQILINVGNINGNEKALKITEKVLAASVTVTADIGIKIVSPSKELTWHYNADLNYSQEDVNVNKQIGFY